MRITQDEIPRSLKYANKIGVIKTLVVDENIKVMELEPS